MWQILFSYLIILLIGIVFYYPTSIVLSQFYAKGYAFSKTLGLLLVGYIYFLSRTVGFNNSFIYAIFLVGAIFLLFRVKDVKKLFKGNAKEILILELVYIVCFLLFLVFRSINPKIEGIEKFMDFALLKSLSKTNSFPFTDVWYSTKSLNYYYFGQIVPASIINIFKLNSYYFYNIYIANIFSICFVTLLTIGKTLTNKFKYGLLLSFVTLVCGNLDLITNKLLLKPSYFYASARSLIEYAITEFPAYSFLISDLHAHVVNLIAVILTLAVCFNIFLKGKINKADLGITGFLLGVMYVTNSWDFIIYTPIVLTTLVTTYKHSSLKKLAISIAIISLLAVVLFLPFYLTFEPAVSGIGLKINFSNLKAILIMFGYFLAATIPFITYYLLYEKKKIDLKLITVLLFFYSIVLILAPNIVFLKDIYFDTNPQYYRANTVFKFWFQAWILLSIASTLSIYYFSGIKSKYFKRTYFIFVGVFLFAILIYPINSVIYIYKSNSNTKFKTVDGSKFLQTDLSDEYGAINWLNINSKNQVNILEKPGDAYTTDSLISTFTGNPTVIGWINHEYGWRNNWGEMSVILMDIETIYTSQDVILVEKLLKKYKINYVVIGNKEKERYGTSTGVSIEKIGTLVYKNNSVKIVKVN